MAGMTKKRSKTVLIYIRVPIEVWSQKNIVKKLTFKKLSKKMLVIIFKKINEIAHSSNLLRICFFKRCAKEDVVAAVFMFEHTLFQIFGPRNDILFRPLVVLQRGISNVMCDLVLYLFSACYSFSKWIDNLLSMNHSQRAENSLFETFSVFSTSLSW